MIKGLYEAIDAKNLTSFISYLAPDCTFRFGNGAPVSGKENIRQYVETFFNSIEGLSHDIIDVWGVPDSEICHGFVTYTRKDSSKLSVPFSTIIKVGTEGINEYLIFADVSQLYA